MSDSPESVRDWRRAAVIAGATYFFIFAAAVSLFEVLNSLIAFPGVAAAPDFDIQEPILLVTCWIAALAAANASRVALKIAPRLLMGVTGFFLLMLAETYVSIVLQNESPVAFLRGFGTANGVLRLIGYVAFGVAPVLQIWVRLHLPDEHSDSANSAHR